MYNLNFESLALAISPLYVLSYWAALFVVVRSIYSKLTVFAQFSSGT